MFVERVSGYEAQVNGSRGYVVQVGAMAFQVIEKLLRGLTEYM